MCRRSAVADAASADIDRRQNHRVSAAPARPDQPRPERDQRAGDAECFSPMTQRSFVCARAKRGRIGETKPDAKDIDTRRRTRTTRNRSLWNVVGEDAHTAFAPALPSPLRKTAPYGRPVHRLGDCAGRSPGSRVIAVASGLPSFPVAMSDVRLAAHSCGGSHGLLQIRAFEFVASVFPLSSPDLTRGTSTVKCSLERCAQVKRRLSGP